MLTTAALTDAEVADICAPLTQGAAMVRYLRALGVPVERKPNGRPLVRRADWDRAQNRDAARPRVKAPRVVLLNSHT